MSSNSSSIFHPRGSRRRYRFRDHGRSDRFYRGRRLLGQEKQVQNGIYQAVDFDKVEFSKIVAHENLLKAFELLRREGGRAPGIDKLSYRDFSRPEIADVLRLVSTQIKARRYRPHPTRAIEIAKSGGGTRTLRLAVIVDRIVAKAVQLAVGGLLDGIFLDCSHGFRRKRSPLTFLAALELAVVVDGNTVVAQDDVYHCFDEIRIADVVNDYRQYIHNESVIRLIETILRGHAGADHILGIDQGTAIGPGSTNLRLHHALDLPLAPQTRQETTGGPRAVTDPGNYPFLLRYVDNLVFACRNVPDGHASLSQADQLLQAAGMRFKGKDGPPTDLRTPGAQVQLLGFELSMENGRLQYHLPEDAWGGLGEALEDVHATENPAQAANEAVVGWLTAYAPAIGKTDEQNIVLRVRMEAVRAGFRELMLTEVLLQGLHQGRQRWETLRSQTMAREDLSGG